MSKVDKRVAKQEIDDIEKNRNAYDDAEEPVFTGEDTKLNMKMISNAYELNDFNLIDEIINEMIPKSNIPGLTKLHSACGYGFAELVEKYLAEPNCDPNCECVFYELGSITPLHFSAGIGPDPIAPYRDKCIELLIKQGADVNKCTTRQDTPLHWASKISNKRICQTLIRAGADVSLLNSDSCTCAHGAAFYKNLDVLEYLMEHKVDVNRADCSGKTILHLLCKDSFEPTNAVSALDHDESNPSSINPSLFVKDNNNTATSSAGPRSLKSQTQLVNIITNLLEKYKMNVNAKDSVGFTPIMYAAEYGNIELIKVLLNYGADVNVCSDEGITCMLLAIVNAETEVVRCLIDNGFNIKDNKSNCSYLTDAAYLNDIEIVDLLLKAGYDVNETKQDENGAILNPLWAACERGNPEIVEKLLKHGANVVIRKDLNMTALHCVAMAQVECVPIAKLLVEYKCPIDVRTVGALETPLFLACNSGFTELAEFLLQEGVNPNQCASASRTCFQQSVFRGHKDIVLLLINNKYQLTEDDKRDLNIFIMDLYQENDTETLKYIIKRNITTQDHVLKCIKETPILDANSKRKKSSNTITTMQQLEFYLNSKCNINASKASLDEEEEDEELK